MDPHGAAATGGQIRDVIASFTHDPSSEHEDLLFFLVCASNGAQAGYRCDSVTGSWYDPCAGVSCSSWDPTDELWGAFKFLILDDVGACLGGSAVSCAMILPWGKVLKPFKALRWLRFGDEAADVARYGDEVVQTAASRASSRAVGFPSFGAFRRAFGSAGLDMQWHHVVEQTPSNVARFGAETIHNTSNIVALDIATHRRISGYYSSIRGFTGGQTVRAWLSGQPFDVQREFGFQVLQDFGVGM